MAKKGEIGKEGMSVNIRSTTIEVLEKYMAVMEITNKSEFVDEAIREKISREFFKNPLAWRKLSQNLDDLSS